MKEMPLQKRSLPIQQAMDTIQKNDNQVYTSGYGSFTIEQTRFMWKSVDAETGKDLVFAATPEAVWHMTPTHLEAHALGLKEERSYAGTVGGKL